MLPWYILRLYASYLHKVSVHQDKNKFYTLEKTLFTENE